MDEESFLNWLIFPASLTTLILIIGTILQILLILRRNSFPYTNISYIWQLVYVFIVMITQICFTIDYLYFKIDINSNIRTISYVLSNTFNQYMFMIPNLCRCLYYSRSLKLSYFHMNKVSVTKNDNIFNKSFFENRFTNKRETYLLKLIFIPLVIIFVLSISLIFIPHVQCFMFNINGFNQYFLNSCNKTLEFCSNAITSHMLIGLATFIVQAGINVFFLCKLLWYPIKKDTFYIIYEIIMTFSIWLISYIVINSLKSFSNDILGDDSSSSTNLQFFLYKRVFFYCVSVMNLLYMIFYSHLMIIRSKIDDTQIKSILKDFNLFLHNHICFSFYKNYLKNDEGYYKYLLFWLEANMFKRIVLINLDSLAQTENSQASKLTKYSKDKKVSIKSKASVDIMAKASHQSIITPISNNIIVDSECPALFLHDKTKAKLIYDEFFYEETSSLSLTNNNSFTNEKIQSSIKIIRKLTKEEKYREKIQKIDFPPDIREKLEMYVSMNFNQFNNQMELLSTVFDDALCYVYHKLYDKFIALCRDREEYSNLEKLVYYFDFYDFKEKEQRNMRITEVGIE